MSASILVPKQDRDALMARVTGIYPEKEPSLRQRKGIAAAAAVAAAAVVAANSDNLTETKNEV